MFKVLTGHDPSFLQLVEDGLADDDVIVTLGIVVVLTGGEAFGDVSFEFLLLQSIGNLKIRNVSETFECLKSESSMNEVDASSLIRQVRRPNCPR